MPSARSIPRRRPNGKYSGTHCETDLTDRIPPAMRVLLNTPSPRGIATLRTDYELNAWETAALGLLKLEDNQLNIKLEKLTQVPLEDAFPLEVRDNQNLVHPNTRINGGKLALASPNVDLTRRDNPTPQEKQEHSGTHTVHRLYLAAAFRVLMGTSQQVPNGNTGVGALVVSASGRVLAWGKKNGDHPLLHAETSALLMYGDALPKGARIYSTLKPCRMCRAAIAHFATDSDFLAYYAQDDPTSAAFGTTSPQFVQLGDGAERPLWADDRKGEDALRRTSVNRVLEVGYDAAKRSRPHLGIIDFLRGNKQDKHLTRATGYLVVKQYKYTNERLSERYNANVSSCLRHIAEVMKSLGLPLPEKK